MDVIVPTLKNCLLFLTFVLTIDCYANNIILNPNFDQVDQNITYWKFDGWQLNLDISTYEIVQDNNSRYLLIKNSDNAHTYMQQDIWLDEKSNYLFTAQVKSTNVLNTAIGVNIGLVSHGNKGCDARGNTEWTKCALQISNNGPRKNVSIMLSLGHYSNLNQGHAFFKNVSIVKQENIASKVPTIMLGKSNEHLKKHYFIPPKNVLLILTLSIALIILFAMLSITIKRSPKNNKDKISHT